MNTQNQQYLSKFEETPTFSVYQELSGKTAQYPREIAIAYCALGIGGESGEILEKIKKVYRNKAGVFSESDKNDIEKEIGDVFWYLAQLATELGIDFNQVGKSNLVKLFDRQERNVICSSGDNR